MPARAALPTRSSNNRKGVAWSCRQTQRICIAPPGKEMRGGGIAQPRSVKHMHRLASQCTAGARPGNAKERNAEHGRGEARLRNERQRHCIEKHSRAEGQHSDGPLRECVAQQCMAEAEESAATPRNWKGKQCDGVVMICVAREKQRKTLLRLSRALRCEE